MELAHPLEVNPPSLYETPETAWPGHFISAYGLAYTLCWKIRNTLTEEEAWQEIIENSAIAATDRLHWAYFGNPWFWAKWQWELNAPGHGRISSAQAQVNAAALAFAQRKCMADHMAQRKRGCQQFNRMAGAFMRMCDRHDQQQYPGMICPPRIPPSDSKAAKREDKMPFFEIVD